MWLIALLILALPGLAEADLQSQIDSLQAVLDSTANADSTAVRKADLDTVIANRPKLVAAGITVLVDKKDGQWIEVDFPVSGATGSKKAALKFGYWSLINQWGAKATATAYRVRIHFQNAKQALKWWNKNIL
tara:strand:- start:74 stop:469 length:396 start_codon:yes stop_codon:yes gene_type:complete